MWCHDTLAEKHMRGFYMAIIARVAVCSVLCHNKLNDQGFLKYLDEQCQRILLTISPLTPTPTPTPTLTKPSRHPGSNAKQSEPVRTSCPPQHERNNPDALQRNPVAANETRYSHICCFRPSTAPTPRPARGYYEATRFESHTGD